MRSGQVLLHRGQRSLTRPQLRAPVQRAQADPQILQPVPTARPRDEFARAILHPQRTASVPLASHPQPSPSTKISNHGSLHVTRCQACFARACFTTLCNASFTTRNNCCRVCRAAGGSKRVGQFSSHSSPLDNGAIARGHDAWSAGPARLGSNGLAPQPTAGAGGRTCSRRARAR